MIDNRQQVKETLEGICSRVLGPVQELTGEQELPFLKYGEVVHTTGSQPYTERQEYDIDVFTDTPAEAIQLANKVADAMQALGYEIGYISPDTDLRYDEGLYHKTITATATIDVINKMTTMYFKQ